MVIHARTGPNAEIQHAFGTVCFHDHFNHSDDEQRVSIELDAHPIV